ncbi:MAG: hypothetical protein EA352_07265 [Gemmatimonadales bacterium]|nr:MAG: hypothetical protein EA352_07265 [Gemmatimonadales bacterium]
MTGPPPFLVGVVPAAGRSGRMGGSAKPLLDTGEGTFLERVVRALREGGASAVVVGVREDPSPLAAHARELGTRVLVPPGLEEGPIATLRAALDGPSAEGPGGGDHGQAPDAILYLPADMPLVRPETVAAVVRGWAEEPESAHSSPPTRPTVVLPQWRGQTGHPALFAGSALQDLLEPDLPEGARTVVEHHRAAGTLKTVPVEDRGTTVDIDTVPEYRRHFPRAFRKRFQKW